MSVAEKNIRNGRSENPKGTLDQLFLEKHLVSGGMPREAAAVVSGRKQIEKQKK